MIYSSSTFIVDISPFVLNPWYFILHPSHPIFYQSLRLHPAGSGGNGGRNIQKTCPVYSGLFDKTVQNMWTTYLKKICHQTIYLALDWHWRLARNCCLLDKVNELDDGVRQTHVKGANRGDIIIFFNLQLILRQNITENLKNFTLYACLSLWGRTIWRD